MSFSQGKDFRDQSMSVLLPPAQDQRVFTVGGGTIAGVANAIIVAAR